VSDIEPKETPESRQTLAQLLRPSGRAPLPAVGLRAQDQLERELFVLAGASQCRGEAHQRVDLEARFDRKEGAAGETGLRGARGAGVARDLVHWRELDPGVRSAQHTADELLLAARDPDAQTNLVRAADQAQADEGLARQEALVRRSQQCVEALEEVPRWCQRDRRGDLIERWGR
jgi:hypothetical protein